MTSVPNVRPLAAHKTKIVATIGPASESPEMLERLMRSGLNVARLPQVVKPGDRLFLNDGLVQLVVESVAGNDEHCAVAVGRELRSKKGLNLPGINLGISAFTEHDRAPRVRARPRRGCGEPVV